MAPAESLAMVVGGDGWRRACFVILKAFADESGTHNGTKFMTVGGHVARVPRWHDFDRQWRKKIIAAVPDDHFHAKDFMKLSRSQAEFERKHGLMGEMELLCERRLMFGLSVTLDREAFREVYARPVKGVRFDSEYGLCSRVLVYESAALVERSFSAERPKVHYIFESGHKNAGDAVRAFDDLKQRAPQDVRDTLGSLTFGAKRDHPGLQLADTLAHIAWRSETKGVTVEHTQAGPDLSSSYTVADLPKGCPRLRYVVTEEAMTRWREEAIADLERRRDYWRARKGAA